MSAILRFAERSGAQIACDMNKAQGTFDTLLASALS